MTIGILIYTFPSVIRHILTIIMPFYGIFVTFQNHDFWALFWPYWKRDGANIALMMLKRQERSALRFTKWFEAVGVVSRVHNYENLDFSKYRPTFNLFYKKGMSFEMILGYYNYSLVSILVNRHERLVLIGHCKNFWTKISEKNAEISPKFSKNRL